MGIERLHEKFIHAKKELQRRRVGNQPICHRQQGSRTVVVCAFMSQCISMPEPAYAGDLDLVLDT